MTRREQNPIFNRDPGQSTPQKCLKNVPVSPYQERKHVEHHFFLQLLSLFLVCGEWRDHTRQKTEVTPFGNAEVFATAAAARYPVSLENLSRSACAGPTPAACGQPHGVSTSRTVRHEAICRFVLPVCFALLKNGPAPLLRLPHVLRSALSCLPGYRCIPLARWGVLWKQDDAGGCLASCRGGESTTCGVTFFVAVRGVYG